MGKSKSRKDGHPRDMHTLTMSAAEGHIQAYDPTLISLFAQSLGAVKHAVRPAPLLESQSHSTTAGATRPSKCFQVADTEKGSILSNTSREDVYSDLSRVGHTKASILRNNVATGSSRTRKRNDAEDDLEGRYMSQFVRAEVQDDQNSVLNRSDKRPKLDFDRLPNADMGSLDKDGETRSDIDAVTGRGEERGAGDVPQHESMVTLKANLDLEKSLRTVFLANVSTTAIKSKKAKRALTDHLTSFVSLLPATNERHGIESLRFRSTPFLASAMPKKAAFVRKEILDTTTRSTNAYVVYTTQLAARESVSRLNGSIVLDRHLRVDSVARPAKVHHRRCVFVGNLGFVDDETHSKADRDEGTNKTPREAKEPADIEEGLWRQFEKAGTVESVRVVRDRMTRVGKGFAYIQFKDAISVEKALLYSGKKFPPLLPRILRIARAKNANNTKSAANRKERAILRKVEVSTGYRPKVPSQVQSLRRRAHEPLGRAGEGNLKATISSSSRIVDGVDNSANSMIFEGLRASSSDRKGTLDAAGRKHNKRSNRSTKFRMKGKNRSKL